MANNYTPTGVLEFTGEDDSGKTSAALFMNYQYGIPMNKIAFFHDDVKEPPSKDFGLFIDLKQACKDMKLLERYEYTMSVLDKIKPGEYQAIIFDTWERTGLSIQRFAKANSHLFREKKAYIAEPNIKFREEWKEAFNYEAQVVSNIKNKVDCFIVTSHLKDAYRGKVKVPGKETSELSKTWRTVCNMRLWLRHNPNSSIPIALVIKRIQKFGLDDNGIATTVNVLPRKITPLPEETSIWQSINRYWHDPMGNRAPLPEEKPTPFELSILEGTLTVAQKEAWKAELRAAKQEEKELQEFLNLQFNEVKARVNELSQAYNGKPPPIVLDEIWPQIKEEYPDYTKEQIEEMI